MKSKKVGAGHQVVEVPLGALAKSYRLLNSSLALIVVGSAIVAGALPISENYFGYDNYLSIFLFLFVFCWILELVITKANDMVNRPLGSLLVDDKNNSLTVRWGYPRTKREKVYKLSSLNAIELMVLAARPDYGQLYLRLGERLVPLPSSVDATNRHEEACKLAEVFQVPVFRLKSLVAKDPTIEERRLPYYIPVSAREATVKLLEGAAAEDILKEIESELKVEEACCQFCGYSLSEGEVVGCVACATPHHRDCFEANGQCTTYSCECCEFVLLEQKQLPS